MGGEGPAIRFSQGVSVATSWANHTGLEPLDKEELKVGYTRAKGFLLQSAMTLVNDHGWRPEEPDSNVNHRDFCIVRRLTTF
jgi:hypothetical protein